MTGAKGTSPFNLWFQGTFGLYDQTGSYGDFGLAFAGADYVINPNLLIGAIVQYDAITQTSTTNSATASGEGWMAGPYATVRLAPNLFFSIRAEGGRSWDKISPYGTYTDGVGATRWLVDGSLAGQYRMGAWTLTPGIRVSSLRQTTDAYTDSMGIGVPSVDGRADPGRADAGLGLHVLSRRRHPADAGCEVRGHRRLHRRRQFVPLPGA